MAGAELAIAYVFHPLFWPCVEALPSCRVVYHADDRFTAMLGSTSEAAELERALCERADRIFAVTPGIAAALGQAAVGKTVIVPNGADADAYGRASRSPVPAQLAAIPHPQIAYAGSLNEKIDFPLIARLARARPNIRWLRIGPAVTSASSAAAHARVSMRAAGLPTFNSSARRTTATCRAIARTSTPTQCSIGRTEQDGGATSIR